MAKNQSKKKDKQADIFTSGSFADDVFKILEDARTRDHHDVVVDILKKYKEKGPKEPEQNITYELFPEEPSPRGMLFKQEITANKLDPKVKKYWDDLVNVEQPKMPIRYLKFLSLEKARDFLAYLVYYALKKSDDKRIVLCSWGLMAEYPQSQIQERRKAFIKQTGFIGKGVYDIEAVNALTEGELVKKCSTLSYSENNCYKEIVRELIRSHMTYSVLTEMALYAHRLVNWRNTGAILRETGTEMAEPDFSDFDTLQLAMKALVRLKGRPIDVEMMDEGKLDPGEIELDVFMEPGRRCHQIYEAYADPELNSRLAWDLYGDTVLPMNRRHGPIHIMGKFAFCDEDGELNYKEGVIRIEAPFEGATPLVRFGHPLLPMQSLAEYGNQTFKMFEQSELEDEDEMGDDE